jgi:hypothetical protein
MVQEERCTRREIDGEEPVVARLKGSLAIRDRQLGFNRFERRPPASRPRFQIMSEVSVTLQQQEPLYG